MAPTTNSLQGLNIIHPVQPSISGADAHDLLAGQSYLPDLSAQLDLWTNLAFADEDSQKAPVEDNHHHEQPASFDLNAFLASFQQVPSVSPSLAQLIASHPGPQPAPIQPPAKRSRTRKLSISDASPSPESPTQRQNPSTITTGAGAPVNQQQTVAAAEDKRRRNTAASARFRLKKKEREAALEGKAKELEQRVSELERECEGLRRENGWLKGLVVGVTGAAQAPTVPSSASTTAASGLKRAREDA